MTSGSRSKQLCASAFSPLVSAYTSARRLRAAYACAMPERPRAHTIEDESELAFRQAIPREWVARKLVPDYGIDLTVEIFDEKGHSTPFSFHVQLRATDEEDTTRALRSIRFRRDTAEHYWSLPIPVLIVRYQADGRRLFARWWHAYNPLVATRPEAVRASRTVGFVFQETDAWSEDTPRALHDGVASFRRFRSPELALPLTFSVSAEEVMSADLMPQLLALRQALSPVSDLVAVQPHIAGPDRPHIILRRRTATVALGDVASVTVEHDGEQSDRAVAGANLGCAVAVLLTIVGQTNLAAQVAAACGAGSTAITNVETAFTLAGAFFRSQRISEALTLFKDLAVRGDAEGRIAAFALYTAVLARGAHRSHAESRQATEAVRAVLDATLASGDSAASAASAYTLGNTLFGAGLWAEAVSAFELAIKLNPAYKNRSYLQAELAGCLFESGRYSEAVTRYEKAMALSDDRSYEPRLADCLMYAGRYAEALRTFEGYLANEHAPSDAVWRLKARALRNVVSLVADTQARRPDEALGFAEQIDPEDPTLTQERAVELLDAAFEADGCCGVAHRLHALMSLSVEDGEAVADAAVEPAISAAVLLQRDPNAWNFAIRVSSFSDEPDDVLYDLARVGIRSAGPLVVSLALDPNLEALDGRVLGILDRAQRDLEDEMRRGGFVIRVPARDGTMEEFPFAPPE